MSDKKAKVFTDVRDLPKSDKVRIVCSCTEYHHRDGEWLGSWKRKTVYTIKSVSLGTPVPLRGHAERRYREFKTFYQALSAKYGDIIPDFLSSTNKWTKDHFSQEFLEARRLLLIDWLNNTININEDILNDDLVFDFLSIKRSTAGDFALAGNGGGASLQIASSSAGMTTMFSMTSSERVALTDADRAYLPTESVMSVHRIGNDDL